MPLEIPLTFNDVKISRFFKKFLPLFGYVIWVGIIVYFLYRYFVLKNNSLFVLAMVLLGLLLMDFYDKWKKSR